MFTNFTLIIYLTAKYCVELSRSFFIVYNSSSSSSSQQSQKNRTFQNPKFVMAEHLASIFGTEKDRVNCPFYFKIGACRHGDRCSRLHTKPSISPTILLSNMYQRPDSITPGVDAQGNPIDPRKIQEHFEVYPLSFSAVNYYFCHDLTWFMIWLLLLRYTQLGFSLNLSILLIIVATIWLFHEKDLCFRCFSVNDSEFCVVYDMIASSEVYPVKFFCFTYLFYWVIVASIFVCFMKKMDCFVEVL